MKRFFKTSLLFTIGLLTVALLADARVGREIRRRHGRYNGQPLVGWDVYAAVERAETPGPEVRTVYLGDSVARQLFMPGKDPNPRVRYLCSNQAISLAGQYYLLRKALKSCPDVREVDFLYFPGSWGNDLPRELSHDYFCGYFHEPAEVAETFAVKKDFDLLAAHAGRCLFPNLLAANGASRPFTFAPPRPPGPAGSGSFAAPPNDPEPLLAAMTAAAGGFSPPAPPPPGAIPFSGVSRYFLPKIRDSCRARGVRLRVLPSPCSDAARYAPRDGPYDAEILYVDRAEFLPDGIHLQDAYIDPVRRRVVEKYGLAP